MYYPGRKEGQFDIGLVNRWGTLQAGAFASFKYLDFRQYQSGGGLGQGAFLLDYVFNRGRVGAFVTRGFKNYAILNSVTLAPGAFLQTYARVVNQQGINFLFGAWGDASISGNLAYLKMRENGRDARPGANLKLTQPLSEHLAFTAEASYNETLRHLAAAAGRLVIRTRVRQLTSQPKEYANHLAGAHGHSARPVRIRYAARGQRPPVANAGPNQIGVAAGTVTLNGTGSYDPLGLPLTYAWMQIAGPTVSLSGANTADAELHRRRRSDLRIPLDGDATPTASRARTTSPRFGRYADSRSASFSSMPTRPPSQPGQSSTLTWVVENAISVAITPGVGNVDAHSGSVSVSPTQTTTYTLTANGPTGTSTLP